MNSKKSRVLVVDDEIELMTALSEILNENGYEVSGFSSCTDALRTLGEQDFDLLLLDLMMPEMNGIEFLKEAQRIDPNVVGILMTGYGTVHTAVEAIKVGAFDYVLKPFKINRLLTVLYRALDMRRLRNENLQLRETMAIYDLAMTVSNTIDRNVILNKIADAVLDQCEADEMSIMLPTNMGDELYTAVIRGEQNEAVLGERIPMHEGIVGWVVSNRKELLLDEEGKEIKSSLSMPLLAGGKCVGVINVDSKKRRSFLLRKVKALKILASTAASALENARLYAELRESEEKYRQIVETANEGIWVIDRACRTSFVNKKMAEMLASTVKEMSGKSIYDFIDHEWIAEAEKHVKHRQERSFEQYEFKLRRQDGKELWAILSTNPLFESNGHYSGSLAMVTDVTTRKQFEKEMARLDRLNLIGQMAAGIGHEVRNPMTTIRGFLQLFLKKPHFIKYENELLLMIEELDRANTIITEFLCLAKTKPTEIKPVNLNKVINDLYPLLQADAFRRGHDLTIVLANVPDILADEKELRQCLLNLVHNGLEAMMTAGVIELKTYIEEDRVVLAIHDEGAGIPPHLQEKLGTPFFTTKDNGTGLGLPICYSIVERHNAQIDFDTGPKGTTFFIRFRSENDLKTSYFIEQHLEKNPRALPLVAVKPQVSAVGI